MNADAGSVDSRGVNGELVQVPEGQGSAQPATSQVPAHEQQGGPRSGLHTPMKVQAAQGLTSEEEALVSRQTTVAGLMSALTDTLAKMASATRNQQQIVQIEYQQESLYRSNLENLNSHLGEPSGSQPSFRNYPPGQEQRQPGPIPNANTGARAGGDSLNRRPAGAQRQFLEPAANIAAALAGNPLQFILPQRAPERLSAAPTAKAVGAACHRHPGSD